MSVVRRPPCDPIDDLYQRVARVDKRVDRVVRNATTVNIENATLLNDGDGSIWADAADGTLHWIVGGVEYKVSGTVVP